MLLDFLVAPHVTTDVILSEKEQECIKKPKTKEKSAHDEEEDDENGVPAEDGEPENSEGKEKKFESEEPEYSKGKEKEFESEEAAEDDKEKDPEEKSSGKKVDKGEEGKSKESGESCPSMEHMRDEIKCFLRGYDLFTVTFDGMIEHFNILGIDLTTRKEAVQLMLQEEMEKIDNDFFHLEFEGCDNNQWQFQSDLFFPTKKEESRNMKKEESEDSKTEKTNSMMKKANTEDTKKEEAKDMEKEETDYVQDVEMEDREAEDSKLVEGKNVIKEQDNKDVEGKVEEIKEAEGGAEGSRKKWIRGQKGSEKGEAEEKKESENEAKEGRGTPLKDIPNVAHKVGKKKPAELKLLHQTLFGGVEKAIDYKNHILQFSGFAWHESEDKQKTKVKEKLDKCTKDTLLDFCDLFDIPALKAKSKERKEELVAMLLDFMVAPHVTTDVILSEKEQSSKSRKRKKGSKDSGLKKSGLSGKRSRKECIKKPKTKERSAHDEEEDDENGVPAEDDEPENSEGKEKEFESEETAEDDKETDPEEKSSGKKVDKGEEGKSKESWESGPSMEHMRDKIKCFLRSYDLFTVTFDDMIEHFAWSSTPALAQTDAASAGICMSRLEIYGYQCEEHTVTTKDGYVLSLQRIPNGRHSDASDRTKKKIPVLLQHGIMVDGITWLLNSPEDALGYILADSGFDVWIANTRGTVFSRRHTKFSVNDSAYWDWTWDELVAYDLPATYEYVYRNSGRQKIHYVGHSLGTLMALASFSEMKLAGMTRSAGLLCPVAYVDKVKSALARSGADVFLAETYYWLGLAEFNPTGKPVQALLKKLCVQPGINCYDLITTFTGKNCCLNSSSVKVFLDHEPQSTSTKNLVHMAQMLRTGTLRRFDYGDSNRNMKHYGQPDPPAYNMSAIPEDLPLYFSYGGRDDLADTDDVEHLLAELKSHKKDRMRVHFQPSFAHGDFIMGINARQLIYEPLISFLKLHN